MKMQCLEPRVAAVGERLLTLLIMSQLISFLTGCTPLQQYRTGYPPYSPAAAGSPVIQTNTIEESTTNLVGYVEFDDHGWLWDARQMHAVLDRVAEEDKKQGLLIVVFAHGWKHNASFQDGNVASFRSVLTELQEVENKSNGQSPRPPRKVVGVYLGWRGLSQKLWGLKEFSFWERKRTAQAVGQGAVSEVLVGLEEVRKRSRIEHQDQEARNLRSPTMLVVVGHSFGGAVVYSALGPLLQERLIDTLGSDGQVKPPRGFGDLVVLVNPAFEAALFQVLKRSSDEHNFGTNQPATLAVFTSKADWATKYAFKAGRLVSTVFEKNRDHTQYGANVTAVGHFTPYITHDLNFAPPKAASSTTTNVPPAKSPKLGSAAYAGHRTTGASADRIQQLRGQVHLTRSKPKQDVTTEDSTYHFSQTVLAPRPAIHKPHDPVYVVSVDKRIIPSHDDFETEGFLTFLREFILAFAGNP